MTKHTHVYVYLYIYNDVNKKKISHVFKEEEKIKRMVGMGSFEYLLLNNLVCKQRSKNLEIENLSI